MQANGGTVGGVAAPREEQRRAAAQSETEYRFDHALNTARQRIATGTPRRRPRSPAGGRPGPPAPQPPTRRRCRRSSSRRGTPGSARRRWPWPRPKAASRRSPRRPGPARRKRARGRGGRGRVDEGGEELGPSTQQRRRDRTRSRVRIRRTHRPAARRARQARSSPAKPVAGVPVETSDGQARGDGVSDADARRRRGQDPLRRSPAYADQLARHQRATWTAAEQAQREMAETPQTAEGDSDPRPAA